MKIIKRFSDLKLNFKIALFVVLITIPFVFFLIFFLLNSLIQTSLDIEAESFEDTMFLIKQDLIRNVSAKAQVYDFTLKNMIIDLQPAKDSLVSEGEISDKFLADYYYKHQIISDIFFISPVSFKVFPQDKADLEQKKELFSLIAESEKRYAGFWLGPYDDLRNQKRIMTYVLPVWEENNLNGVLGIDVDVDILLTEIIQADISKLSYVVIVRNTGEFISSSEKFYDDFEIEKKEESVIFSSQIVKKQGIEEIFTLTGKEKGMFEISGDADESQRIVSFSIIPSFSGKILIVSPLTEIIEIQKEKAKEIQQSVYNIGIAAFAGVIIFLLLFIFSLLYFLRKTIIGPIGKLKRGMEILEKTRFKTEIEIKAKDEIGELAVGFNNMARRLKDSYEGLEQKILEKTKELKELNEVLEMKVEEKTKELNEHIKKIEKLQKFFVGRELKMIDLKKEIKALKKEKPGGEEKKE